MGSKRMMRADVFGITKMDDEKVIYLLEGKHYLKGRANFSKVLCEAMPLLEYADFVYIFGISEEEDFKTLNSKYFEICKLLGIGILIFNENGEINEIIHPNKNIIDYLDKKEMIFRIFTKNVKNPISHLIFQSAYEYLKINDLESCAQYIEIYNALLPNKEYKNILKKVLGDKHSLDEKGMRKAFQNVFGETDLIKIERMNRVIDDYICITQKGTKMSKEPILLDIN